MSPSATYNETEHNTAEWSEMSSVSSLTLKTLKEACATAAEDAASHCQNVLLPLKNVYLGVTKHSARPAGRCSYSLYSQVWFAFGDRRLRANRCLRNNLPPSMCKTTTEELSNEQILPKQEHVVVRILEQ